MPGREEAYASSFAAGVNREVISAGCERLGLSIEDVIGECIQGMRKDAEKLGLASDRP